MSIGLIGTKLGMTREFMTSGQSVPVTVIKIEKGRVLYINACFFREETPKLFSNPKTMQA